MLRVANASREFIRELAKEYLQDFATMNSLAKKYHSSPQTISNILFRGIAEVILDEQTSVAITRKAVANTDNVCRTCARWERAAVLRDQAAKAQDIKNTEAEIQQLQAQLEELEAKLANYDDFFFEEDGVPSKKGLKCQSSRLRARIADLKKLLVAGGNK